MTPDVKTMPTAGGVACKTTPTAAGVVRDGKPAGIGGVPGSASEGTGRSPPTAGGGDCKPSFPQTRGRPGSLAGRLDVVKGRHSQ